jgi:hypothetical protein
VVLGVGAEADSASPARFFRTGGLVLASKGAFVRVISRVEEGESDDERVVLDEELDADTADKFVEVIDAV